MAQYCVDRPWSRHVGNLGQLLREAAMAHRYRPALHDGYATEGVYTYETEIRVRTSVVRARGSGGG